MPVICPLSTLRSLFRIDLREPTPREKLRLSLGGKSIKRHCMGLAIFVA